uniref:Predicted protein n=1 Tax=Hordeum vulgare subsp. vulgare TaxID=112509 RepID=F2CS88_HORVV|nr:predicted protein [Hordeum vulgare subsp. vulgare]
MIVLYRAGIHGFIALHKRGKNSGKSGKKMMMRSPAEAHGVS